MQHSTFKIFIIIPVFNRKEFTKNCLLSLKKQTYNNFKTIVINDGSTDGTSEMLEKEFPEVTEILGDGNLWWTASTNLGIKYALKNNADYILTLNNDTIPGENFIENMLFWAEKIPNALLGAFAIDAATQQSIYGGEIINWKNATYKNLLDNLAKNNPTGLYEVTHFPGRGLLIPAIVFNKIGFFNQKTFPHYYADYDFTHRAARAGYKIYCNYDSKLFIYPLESGDKKNRVNKSLKGYWNHLFGIKGGGNLRNFYYFAFLNCPKKYFPLFLIIGFLRRTAGYLFK